MDSQNPKSVRIQALAQILAVSAMNLLLLAFGLSMAYPTILIGGVTDPKELFNFDKEDISWIGSITLICVPLGCIISGSLSENIGRRRAMQVINIPYVIAWLLFFFSYEKWHIFTALSITGLTGGSLEAPVLTYVSEVCQPYIRGTLASISVMVCYIGFTVMFLFGMFINWRIIALIAVAFHVISFTSLFFVPETPHFLIKKSRYEQARKSLAWLRGWTTIEAIEPEYQEIYQDVTKNEDKKEKLFAIKQLMKKDFLWPYAVVSFVYFISHFCGVSTLSTFSIPIFTTLKSPIDSLDANGILGVIGTLGSITNSLLIYNFGKRVLVFVSLIAVALCYYIIGGYAYTYEIFDIIVVPKNETEGVINNTDEHTWLPLTFLFLSMYVTQVGIRTVPWILACEVFNSETRASAAGICSATTYIINFVCNKTYFATIADLTFPGVFFMYATISLVGCVVIFYTLPETEGKSLIEINEHFAGKRHMGNHVNKKVKKEDDMVLYIRNNEGFYGEALKGGLNKRANPDDGSMKVKCYSVNKF